MTWQEVLEFLKSIKEQHTNKYVNGIPQMIFFALAKKDKGWRNTQELSNALKVLVKRREIVIGDHFDIRVLD